MKMKKLNDKKLEIKPKIIGDEAKLTALTIDFPSSYPFSRSSFQ